MNTILLENKPHMSKVNLDALIPRADFVSQTTKNESKVNFANITMHHLYSGNQGNFSFYDLLKKPDFQRETSEWDKKRIMELIECFILGHFVPAIILWKNPSTHEIFVIDGAHRLSALIAYFNDDYGDGKISRKMYGNNIPDAEIKLAEETREYIHQKIGGSFQEILTNPNFADKANRLRTESFFDRQVIEGNYTYAEESFFKINQQGVILSPHEKELCKSRKKASCIATRIIMRGAAGSQYWGEFEANNKGRINALAHELNTILFTPPHDERIRSTDLHNPLGGAVTSAMNMIFELMKIINADVLKHDEDDYSGNCTLDYLTEARKLIWLILSQNPGSLGLHPTIYFYNGVGKYMQSSFLGVAKLLIENRSPDFILKFTTVRATLEEFLIKYKVILTQIIRKYGSKERSYRHIKGYFLTLIDALSKGMDEEQLISHLKDKYDYINPFEREYVINTKKFSADAKAAAIIDDCLQKSTKCKICGGFVHYLSKDFDHKDDRKFGGGGEVENLQLTHVYCNNSKDKLRAIGFYKD